MVPVTATIDQVPIDAEPPMVAPAKVYGAPEQMVLELPALAVASEFTVITMVLVVAPQGPAGSLVVKVSVTVPVFPVIGEKITAAGLAVADVLLSWLEALVMVPVTAVIDQVPVVAPPPIVAPVNV